jgi:hypothetical protein
MRPEGATVRRNTYHVRRVSAVTAKGSGLTGLIDRVEALGAHMELSNHLGSGTSLSNHRASVVRKVSVGSGLGALVSCRNNFREYVWIQSMSPITA